MPSAVDTTGAVDNTDMTRIPRPRSPLPRLVTHLLGRTEPERVERGIVIVFAALRIGLIAQLSIVWWFQLGSPEIPTAVLPVTTAAILFSVAFVASALRRRELRSTVWGLTDLITGCLALVVTSQLIPRHLQVGSWLHWAPGYLEQVVAFVAGWLRSVRGAFLVGVGVGLLYLACTMPGTDQPVAVLVNVLNYPMFATAAALFGRYTRRLAAGAEENRRRAEESRAQAREAAAALELARYSFHVHNATGLLEAFARADLQPELMPSLRRQAAEEANRLRYEVLRGPQRGTAEDGPILLEKVVWEATAGFGHLPLELSLALGRTAPLARDHARALKQALIALLYNVQLHARASTVTVHADRRDDRWEVTVTDDGVGFDPKPEHYGFGLALQVVDSLQRHQLTVSITSHPGEGTCTTITGPTAT